MDYLSGDVIWCKYAGYPTWPSIVRDHDEVCEELEEMGVKRIGKPRPTEVCVQYLGYGDTKYFGKQAKNKIWPYSPYRDDKLNEGQKRRLKAFDVAVEEADTLINENPPRQEMMETITDGSLKKVKPGRKKGRTPKAEPASRRNSNAKENTFQKVDDSIVEVREEEAEEETEDEREAEDTEFKPNVADRRQKSAKRKQKAEKILPVKKMKLTIDIQGSKLKKRERRAATIDSLIKIKEELEEAMAGLASKLESQKSLTTEYEAARKEYEVAKKAMKSSLKASEVAKESVNQTVSKLRTSTEELDLMDNVDIEKIKQSSIGRTLKRLFKIKDIGPREVSEAAALAKTIKQRWMDSLAPPTQNEDIPRDQDPQPEPQEHFNSPEDENYDKTDVGDKDDHAEEADQIADPESNEGQEDKEMDADEPEAQEDVDMHIPKENTSDVAPDAGEEMEETPKTNGYRNEEGEADDQDDVKATTGGDEVDESKIQDTS